MTDTGTAAARQVAIFRLGAQRLALPLESVREILVVPLLTKVINAPPLVRGIINVRGEIIAVLDLGGYFARPPVESGGGARVILVQTPEREAGLLVDRVEGVGDCGDLEPPPPLLSAPGFVTGVTYADGSLLSVIDPERLFADGQIARL